MSSIGGLPPAAKLSLAGLAFSYISPARARMGDALQALDAALAALAAGAGPTSYRRISADHAVVAGDAVILVDASATVTLPAAALNDQRVLRVKKTGTGYTATIDGDGADIDGDGSIVLSSSVRGAVLLLCDGSDWHIL